MSFEHTQTLIKKTKRNNRKKEKKTHTESIKMRVNKRNKFAYEKNDSRKWSEQIGKKKSATKLKEFCFEENKEQITPEKNHQESLTQC